MTLRSVDLGRVVRLTMAMVAAAAAVAALSGAAAPVSLLLGGAFMLVNVHLIRLLVSRQITPGASKGVAFALLGAKLLLLSLLLVAVFRQFPVAPLSFAFGASLLLVAAVAEAVLLGEPVGGAGDDEGAIQD